MQHDNDAIAIGSAWELFVCRPARSAGKERAKLPEKGVLRFVAFTEGRLRVAIPTWFERILRTGVLDRSTVVIPDAAAAQPYVKDIGFGSCPPGGDFRLCRQLSASYNGTRGGI
jgi:hypothetical protein